jgi:hypothetical protein
MPEEELFSGIDVESHAQAVFLPDDIRTGNGGGLEGRHIVGSPHRPSGVGHPPYRNRAKAKPESGSVIKDTI